MPTGLVDYDFKMEKEALEKAMNDMWARTKTIKGFLVGVSELTPELCIVVEEEVAKLI